MAIIIHHIIIVSHANINRNYFFLANNYYLSRCNFGFAGEEHNFCLMRIGKLITLKYDYLHKFRVNYT